MAALFPVVLCVNLLGWFMVDGVVGVRTRPIRRRRYVAMGKLTIPPHGGAIHVVSPEEWITDWQPGRINNRERGTGRQEEPRWESRSLGNASNDTAYSGEPVTKRKFAKDNTASESTEDGKPKNSTKLPHTDRTKAKSIQQEYGHTQEVEASLSLPNTDSETNVTAVRTASGNVTTGLGKDNDAVTPQQEATSIYIGNSNYTFVAAIHWGLPTKPSFDDVKCSGGVSNRTIVVTSCSCLYVDRWPNPPLPSFYYVTVGHVKYEEITGAPVHKVADILLHPSCAKREELWTGDVAMILLADPISYDRPGHIVQPMNLPNLKMWDASDILVSMSSQRRRCRIIGWSARAPMVDTAIGELIPMEECANPVCKKNMPCPIRSKVNGFMVEITPNEPALLPGALLYCSNHVFSVVNTKRHCKTNNVFAACSPEELLYTRYKFDMEGPAKKELYEYRGRFLNDTEGWETYSYTTTSKSSTPTREKQFASSASIFLPFYLYHPWVIVHALAGYCF